VLFGKASKHHVRPILIQCITSCVGKYTASPEVCGQLPAETSLDIGTTLLLVATEMRRYRLSPAPVSTRHSTLQRERPISLVDSIRLLPFLIDPVGLYFGATLEQRRKIAFRRNSGT
jgi:hypothetical protein